MEATIQKPGESEAGAAPARPARAATGMSIALAGSGGSGVMTAGTLLLAAAAKAGLYGLMVRTSGPQIRGGEAAALVRLAGVPVDALDDGFDLLLAIDWQNVARFADEIPLSPASVVEVDQESMIRSLVAAGVGISLMRDDLAHEASEAGEAVIWPQGAARTVLSLVYRSERDASPEIVAFVRAVELVWRKRRAADRARVAQA